MIELYQRSGSIFWPDTTTDRHCLSVDDLIQHSRKRYPKTFFADELGGSSELTRINSPSLLKRDRDTVYWLVYKFTPTCTDLTLYFCNRDANGQPIERRKIMANEVSGYIFLTNQMDETPTFIGRKILRPVALT